MPSDGRKGLCNNVLLLKAFPVVCVLGVGGGLVQECTTYFHLSLAQGNNPFILVLIALHHFLPLLILYILLTERKYV